LSLHDGRTRSVLSGCHSPFSIQRSSRLFPAVDQKTVNSPRSQEGNVPLFAAKKEKRPRDGASNLLMKMEPASGLEPLTC
jgi:hypothetical protein